MSLSLPLHSLDDGMKDIKPQYLCVMHAEHSPEPKEGEKKITTDAQAFTVSQLGYHYSLIN